MYEEERYRFECKRCEKETNFKPIVVSKRHGIRLECVKCGAIIKKNLNDLK